MPLDARAPDGLTRQALTDVRSAYAQSRETGCTKQHSGHELALDPGRHAWKFPIGRILSCV